VPVSRLCCFENIKECSQKLQLTCRSQCDSVQFVILVVVDRKIQGIRIRNRCNESLVFHHIVLELINRVLEYSPEQFVSPIDALPDLIVNIQVPNDMRIEIVAYSLYRFIKDSKRKM
jgi:hypothetical protein